MLKRDLCATVLAVYLFFLLQQGIDKTCIGSQASSAGLIATLNACDVYIGISPAEIETEAAINDITQCPCDDEPSTGMFAAFDDVFSAFICLCDVYICNVNLKNHTKIVFVTYSIKSCLLL